MVEVEQTFAYVESSIRETMTVINRSSRGIALIVDADRRLIDTLTDGDIRRAILAGFTLETKVAELLKAKASEGAVHPITAPIAANADELRAIFLEHNIRHIPLLLDDGRVGGLVTVDELVPKNDLPLHAVIMAGGFGTRLMPLTEELPKPMLPVGDKPLMEHILGQLRSAGIRDVNVTTHYRADKIVDHFQDGAEFGVRLNYVNEDRPMGTAGALALMDPPSDTLLVLNGDILTNVDYRSMLAYHRDHGAELTLGVRQFDFQVPYGVVDCDGARVERIVEKPSLTFFVNAGIYLVEPSALEHIPRGQRFDMTDLAQRLLAEGQRVMSYPIVEYWLDIGQHADYTRAQEAVRTGQIGT